MHTDLNSGSYTPLGGPYIASLTVKVNDTVEGVNGSPSPTHSHPPAPFFSCPYHLCLCLPIFFPVPIHPFPPLSHFPSLYPPNYSLHRVLSQLLQFEFVLFRFLLLNYFNTSNYLLRSVMAVHSCGVPVHPLAGYRRHPHVHRGLPFWQRHRRPQAQRLRCHIHCAFR